MSSVKLTKHAIERMEERDITIHDVIRALAFGEQMPTRWPSVYRSRIPRSVSPDDAGKACQLSSVVVVYQHGDDRDDFTVFTAY